MSVHYRMVPVKRYPRSKRPFWWEIVNFLASKTTVVTEGKGILEVRPNVVWDKESTVKWITAKKKDPDARRANPKE